MAFEFLFLLVECPILEKATHTHLALVSHDEEWEPGAVQDALGDAAYCPLQQPVKFMCCHDDDIRTILCESSDARRNIVIESDRPRKGRVEFCNLICNEAVAQVFHGSFEETLRLLHQCVTLALTDLEVVWRYHDLHEVERATSRSRQSRDEQGGRCERRHCGNGVIQWDERAKGTASLRIRRERK